MFNELAEDGAWNISLGEGTAVVDLLAENRAYAYATCAGGYRGPEGAYADFGRGPSVYLVKASTTIRVGRFQIDQYDLVSSDAYRSDGETVIDNPVHVGVINHGSQSRDIRIRVWHLDADGEPLIYDEADIVAQGHGLLHREITEKPGTYEVEASFEPDVSASAEWEVPIESDSPIGWRQTIFITPQGEVLIRDAPFERLYS